ncbi:MAG: hypothetical protein V1697_01860 [Candidatus Levyibacteriota bacterium]
MIKVVNTKDVVIKNILAHITNTGGNYSSWYVGIAQDPKKRLFQDHNVKEVGDAWVYDQCLDNMSAREIEDYFVNKLNTDGGTGGGDENAIFVYAYRKTSSTLE